MVRSTLSLALSIIIAVLAAAAPATTDDVSVVPEVAKDTSATVQATAADKSLQFQSLTFGDASSKLFTDEDRSTHDDSSGIRSSGNTNSSSRPLPFCDINSMSMTMFMDGFHSSLLQSRRKEEDTSTNNPETPPPCLNYLLRRWELSTQTRFWIAILSSFGLALCLEALSALRCRIIILQKKKKIDNGSSYCRSPCQQMSVGPCSETTVGPPSTSADDLLQPPPITPTTQPTSSNQEHLWYYHLSLTAIYAIQAVLGYMIMLVTMAYSLEMMGAVVLGLMVGNACFMPLQHGVIGVSEPSVSTSTQYSSLSSSWITDSQQQQSTTDRRPLRHDNGHEVSPLLQPLLPQDQQSNVV